MAYKTKLQVETKIKRDLDLEEESFIQPLELTEYINDAITVIEAYINTLGLKDQYLRKRTTISLVSGTADYAVPTDLFEDKIKEVVYSNGATIYQVKPLVHSSAAEEIEHLNRFSTTDLYKYRIKNESSAAKYLQIIPTSRETTANALVVEYYRDLERVSSDSDLVEVPDVALQFLYQDVRCRVYEKMNDANYQVSLVERERLRDLMISTLEGQLADQRHNLIELDKSIYEESS